MADQPNQQVPSRQVVVDPGIRRTLRRLRRRIRAYVWLEGLSLAVLWLGLMFWVALALDYLPVLVGASEMPRGARIVLLVFVALVLAWVLYRWVLRRAFVRLADHNMALLLERRYDHFRDALVTAVELDEQPDHADPFSREMLEHTGARAAQGIDDVSLGRVFRFRPLFSKLTVACLLVIPIIVFSVINAQAFEIWVNRLILLQEEPWPRTTRVAVVGVEILRDISDASGRVELPTRLDFRDREVRVARGTSVRLLVHADANKEIPEYCTVYYRTVEGDRGQVDMQRIGGSGGDYQLYAYEGKPFEGILSTIEFDVRGRDHRVRDYRITVVDSPAVVETELQCTFPEYMVDEERALWLPRSIKLTRGASLPYGTSVVVTAWTNKPLERVQIYDVTTGETQELVVDDDGEQFSFSIDALTEPLNIELTLFDVDGVVTETPHRMYVDCNLDEAPAVNVRPHGIGDAVTPDVMIPVRGTVRDDYGVEQIWFEVVRGTEDAYLFPVLADGDNTIDDALDFRELRSWGDDGIVLEAGQEITLAVRASDAFDLGAGEPGTPNVGGSEAYPLEVVTQDELLRRLDRRELILRRRFEQTFTEVLEMRDSLDRIRPGDESDAGSDPADRLVDSDPGGGDATPDTEDRAASLRQLRTQRAVQQSEKSTQETVGMAASFEDIRDELVNNRVFKAEDRRERLESQIIGPLHEIGDVMFPELDRRLAALQESLDDLETLPERVDRAVEQTDQILVSMDQVLEKMQELETYNELLGMLRGTIEDQGELIDRTREERRRQLQDLLRRGN